MFIGQYRYNIDDKGRLVIPQEYRKELGERIVINKGFEKCITIYPLDVWNDVVEKMSTLSMNQKDNPGSNLLHSLKPYLRNSRKDKLDQYANLLNITKIADIMKNEKKENNHG